MKRVLVMFVLGLLLSGCFVVRRDIVLVYPMFDQERGWFDESNFTSNGEQIYFTAINNSGQRISYLGGSNFGGMMMGRGTDLACVSCHSSDGRGGLHTMHMDVMDAPDIRYISLSSEGEEDEGDHTHGYEHGDYDLVTFHLAVVGGAHPDGEPLNRDMPRWRMNVHDLTDLFDFLKTLP